MAAYAVWRRPAGAGGRAAANLVRWVAMAKESGQSVASPQPQYCGYGLVRWLKAPVTALCVNETGKLLVLKRLDASCMLEGDLHPDIRQRLARIRELAHGRVAMLISVERDVDGRVFAVWGYEPGERLTDYCSAPERDLRHAARTLRELVLALEAMHDQGIIHGALHDGNVLVDADGRVKLLDVSPLLFSEDTEDLAALRAMLSQVIHRRGDHNTRIGKLLLERIEQKADLRTLSATMSHAADDLAVAPGRRTLAEEELRIRRQARRWALACVLISAALAGLIWLYATSGEVRAPQAPREAMEAR